LPLIFLSQAQIYELCDPLQHKIHLQFPQIRNPRIEEMRIPIEEAERFGTQTQPTETSINKTTDERVYRHIELINEVDIKLEKELKRKPSTREVWDRLEEIQYEKDNCIVEIEDDVMYWKSRKGVENPWQLKNLQSTISRLRRKRREKKAH